MPKTYDVRITTLDAELEFSVEVSSKTQLLLYVVYMASISVLFTVDSLFKRVNLINYAVFVSLSLSLTEKLHWKRVVRSRRTNPGCSGNMVFWLAIC